MNEYYGPFYPKEPTTEHEHYLVSFGINLIGTPDGISWYDLREELKTHNPDGKIVIMDQDYVVILVKDIQLIDTFSPNAMIVRCVDSIPEQFDGTIGKWKFINGEITLNSEYIEANIKHIIDSEVQYASEKIQHFQDLLDTEDSSVDVASLVKQIKVWKTYRISMRKFEESTSIEGLPQRPE